MAYRPAPIPSAEVPVTNADGTMRQEWRNFFSNLTLRNLRDVASTEPANGEVLIFNSTTGKMTPGAN